MTSKGETVKKAMRWFTESERQYRIIDPDQNAQFLNWKKKRKEGERNRNSHRKNEKHVLQVGL
jgi:hypothetical protein